MARKPPTVHGLVLVDKPAGFTSHDVVAKLRKFFGERRIGHTGTLDPDATGLLVVGVGNGTRLIRFMDDFDKTYTCEIVFGTATHTLDDSGDVVARFDMAAPEIGHVRDVIAEKLTGDILQVPPMVSALHHEGRRLHELAREGITVERDARPVTVHRFDVEATSDPMVIAATVRCGAGTYVRSLGADLGMLLGGGAHIRSLRRVGVGPYEIAEASSLEAPVLLPLTQMVRHLQSVVLDDAGVDDARYGRVRQAWDGPGPWAAHDVAGDIVAVFEKWDDQLAKPTVVFGGR